MKTSLDDSIAALLERELDPAFAARAALILRHLQSAAGGSVLDVGCGRGFYIKAIGALYPQASLVGVDFSAEYLAAAQAQASVTAAGLARADACALPFPAGSFDAVVCSEVLEHIEDDAACLAEIHRVLADDGVLLLSVPHHRYPLLWDPLNWLLERAFGTHVPAHIWWLAGIWADHLRLYTAAGIARKVRSAGFELDGMWFTTPRCLPFAHFLLYGIGKNIVERGLCSSCDRFGAGQGSGPLLAWARRLLYAFEDPRPIRTDETATVGIVLKARKRRNRAADIDK